VETTGPDILRLSIGFKAEHKMQKGGSKMLFMIIYTWEPERRNAVIKRRIEKGPLLANETKAIGEWSAIADGKIFRLVEVNDALAALAASRTWTDLGKTEMIPVVVTEDALKAGALMETLAGI
jgi:hypothetical protein